MDAACKDLTQQTLTGGFTWFCGGKLVNSLLDILEQVCHEFLYVSVWCNFVVGCLKLCMMSKITTKSCDFQCLDNLRFRLVVFLCQNHADVDRVLSHDFHMTTCST